MKFSVPEPEIEGKYSKILGDSWGNNVLWYFIGSHQSINIDFIENYRTAIREENFLDYLPVIFRRQ